MRFKDEQKQESIIVATIKMVNEVGFAAASVAKIAKEANVSPATLYIYYKNKEDLLSSTYVAIKKELGSSFLSSLDDSLPLKDALLKLWRVGFDYASKNRDLLQYIDQFATTPYTELVDYSEIDAQFEPIYKLLNKGISDGILKDISIEVMSVFLFYPIMILSNPKQCKTVKLNDENIELTFNLSWDAIKK